MQNTSQSARRNFPCEKEIPVLKKNVPLCEKDVHTLKKFLIDSIGWKVVYNSLKNRVRSKWFCGNAFPFFGRKF